MKNKVKKIITATIVSAMSLTALGVGVKTQNNDNNNEKFVQNYTFRKDFEKTSAITPNKNIGKIVETSTDNQIKYYTNDRQIQFLNNDIKEAEIENNITLPQNYDRFNLFVLSTTPFVSFSNNNDNDEFKINVRFNTDKTIETQQNSLNYEDKEKLNTYNLKRSILLIYANEIYNNNVNFSNETKNEINTHIETLSTSTEDKTISLDAKIDAVNSIISIIENNLTPSSIYYQKNINSNINNLTNNSSNVDKISETSTNQDIANKIACVLNGKCSSSENNASTLNQTQQRNIEHNNNINPLQNTTTNTPEYQNNNLNTQNPAYRRNNLRYRRKNRTNSNINTKSNEIMENQINTRETYNTLRNNNMQETKTMRADRTNENISQEKYTNTTNQNDIGRASRMPYQSTNNFQR